MKSTLILFLLLVFSLKVSAQSERTCLKVFSAHRFELQSYKNEFSNLDFRMTNTEIDPTRKESSLVGREGRDQGEGALTRDALWPTLQKRSSHSKGLSFEQEQQYAHLIQNKLPGWEVARNELITTNLSLVPFYVKKFRYLDVEFEDLIQAGNIGLIKAADKFKPIGLSFSNYVFWEIKDSVQREYFENARTVRIPNYLWKEKINVYKSAVSTLFKKNKGRPTPKDISEELGWSLDEVFRIAELSSKDLSLDSPLPSDKKESSHLDLQEDYSYAIINELIAREQFQEGERVLKFMDAHLKELSETDLKILMGRFGLNDSEKKARSALAEEIGLSSGRTVQSREISLLKKLRKKLLKDFAQEE